MNRYTKSFGITAIFYLFLMVTFLYSFDTEDKKELHSQQTKSTQSVKFTIVQEQRVKEIKEKTKKKIPEKKAKKIDPEKKKPLDKKVIKKSEKKIVKQAIQKKDAKKENLPKKKIQSEQPQVQKNQIKQNKSIETKKKNNLEETNKRKIEQHKYYTQIKQLINNNKYYPRMAIKRGIEGIVKIEFTISKTGELLSFKIIEGKSIFKKSIQNAVKKSFPLKPPKGVLSKDTTLSLKIAYNLY